MQRETGSSAPAESPAAAPAEQPHVLDSSSLFGNAREVLIRHNGREYRLRCTRLGKLILTA